MSAVVRQRLCVIGLTIPPGRLHERRSVFAMLRAGGYRV
jgi:hypothetical protein